MAAPSEEVQKLADEALADQKKLDELVQQLSCDKRVDRQRAASALHIIALTSPELLVPYVDNLIDALNRPEAQTRWETLESISLLVDLDAKSCGKALDAAETALFDEGSGPVRLAAMRFLCKYGATTTARSDKIWPLIDEGIQCYHGDLEFNDMLTAINEFAGGKLSKEVKDALIDRMTFDATNSKGVLQRKAQQILDSAK